MRERQSLARHASAGGNNVAIEVQRKGGSDAALGDDPVIQRGDVLHCDVGITALRLNTDTQHMG